MSAEEPETRTSGPFNFTRSEVKGHTSWPSNFTRSEVTLVGHSILLVERSRVSSWPLNFIRSEVTRLARSILLLQMSRVTQVGRSILSVQRSRVTNWAFNLIRSEVKGHWLVVKSYPFTGLGSHYLAVQFLIQRSRVTLAGCSILYVHR